MTQHWEVHSDGACSGNPGPGGWGVVVLTPLGEEQHYSGGSSDTTNNIMELTAAYKGLEATPEGAYVRVFTDSKYVQQGMSSWVGGWSRKGWKTTSGSPVKNQELWKRLMQICSARRVEWMWVPGHSGHFYNEKADALARAATPNC